MNQMKIGMMLYRFGALGLLFAPGTFFEEPVKTYLAQNHAALSTLLLLYAFPALVGFTLMIVTEEVFRNMPPRFVLIYNILAGLTLAWLLLWWSLWATMPPPHPNDLVLEAMKPLNAIALAAGFGIYIWAWRTKSHSKRVLRFVMTVGWMMAFTSAMNLHMQPTLRHFMGSGIGGLLLILGAIFMAQAVPEE